MKRKAHVDRINKFITSTLKYIREHEKRPGSGMIRHISNEEGFKIYSAALLEGNILKFGEYLKENCCDTHQEHYRYFFYLNKQELLDSFVFSTRPGFERCDGIIDKCSNEVGHELFSIEDIEENEFTVILVDACLNIMNVLSYEDYVFDEEITQLPIVNQENKKILDNKVKNIFPRPKLCTFQVLFYL